MGTSAVAWLAPFGRLLLSLIFISSAVAKLKDWQAPPR